MSKPSNITSESVLENINLVEKSAKQGIRIAFTDKMNQHTGGTKQDKQVLETRIHDAEVGVEAVCHLLRQKYLS